METEGLERIEVVLCPECRVPPCYCKFFGHIVVDAEEEEVVEEEKAETVPSNLPKVIFTVKARSKRKNVTTISGLEGIGVDLKEFSHFVQKKMAIGCSMKNKGNQNVAVIQGDASKMLVQLVKEHCSLQQSQISIVKKAKKKVVPK